MKGVIFAPFFYDNTNHPFSMICDILINDKIKPKVT